MANRVLYIKEINGDTCFQHVTLTIVQDISVDIFVNEDGKEIGKILNRGIRDHKKDDAPKTEMSDLEINMLFDKGQANANEEIKFTIIAKNNGPNKAAGVEVEDMLPNGYLFKSAEPSKGKWQSFVWTIGDMDVNTQESLVITAMVLGKGDTNHKAEISGIEYDQFPNNNSIRTGNRVFVIKTTEKSFDSKAPSAGISKKEAKETEEFIVNNLQNKDAFSPDCIA